ncbi:MAG: FtsX-like permease family protein [Phenylobacterium sp.]|nr:MAG: FtsX-like permease family protein [Phenylobacterium sp.]
MSLIRETLAATSMNIKSLPQRLGASLVTVVGVATTVAVMVALLSIGAGLLKTSTKNIGLDRVIVMPSGAQSEYAGSMAREAVDIVGQAPGVKRAADGRPMVDGTALVVVEVTKKDGGTSNIGLRGVGPMARQINPAVRLTAGRLYRPAVHELIAGKGARSQFKDLDIGDRIALRGTEWTIVGAYEANGGIEENGLIGDADTVLAAFDRTGYQSISARLANPGDFARFKDALTTDPRLDVEPKRYRTYLNDQLKQLTTVLNFVGYFVGVVMAIGAVISALNTMYAAVDARKREIATLRAIGFGGTAVVVSFMVESLVLAVPGALLGAGLAWVAFNGHAISALGLSFPLAVTGPLVLTGVILSLVIGLVGGFAPSLRAAGLPVATALRAT